MSYQVYFADLDEENQALVLALLRLKEESGKLEPGEEELLAKLRAEAALLPQAAFAELPPPAPVQQQQQQRQGGGRRSYPRRGSGNGRGHQGNGDRS
ncbi:MAG: hypothetical protein IIC95_05170 [Chloroflexi bacterium]|nr:hypothetical protein [Chloroflexota bacterium]